MDVTAYRCYHLAQEKGTVVYGLEIVNEDRIGTGEFLYIEAEPEAFQMGRPYRISKEKVI